MTLNFKMLQKSWIFLEMRRRSWKVWNSAGANQVSSWSWV